MPKRSEYMEAFFGVELHTKFSDTLNELTEIEENLKDLSRDIAYLGGNIGEEEFMARVKEARTAAYELGQQVRDTREFLDFYLNSSKESSQIVLERDAYMKLYQIFKWDGKDVRDLKRWIRELREICDLVGLRMEDLVNFSKLTAQPVPEDLTSYPVYAIDRHGYCLTGKMYDAVVHIDEIREEMGEGA